MHRPLTSNGFPNLLFNVAVVSAVQDVACPIFDTNLSITLHEFDHLTTRSVQIVLQMSRGRHLERANI